MILSRKLLFVHVPKTGGTSVRRHLLASLPGHVAEVAGSAEAAPGARGTVRRLIGNKHVDLTAARPIVQLFARCDIPDLPLVLAGVRDPYEREISLYRYWLRNAAQADEELGASWREFEAFTLRASTLDRNLRSFYRLKNVDLPNLRFIRCERMEEDLNEALAVIGVRPAAPLQRLNAARNKVGPLHFTLRSLEAIDARYRAIFDLGLYPRREA
jgi:hypothetical protein